MLPLYASSAPRSIAYLALNAAVDECGQVTSSHSVAGRVFEVQAAWVADPKAAIWCGPTYGHLKTVTRRYVQLVAPNGVVSIRDTGD